MLLVSRSCEQLLIFGSSVLCSESCLSARCGLPSGPLHEWLLVVWIPILLAWVPCPLPIVTVDIILGLIV